MVTESGQYNRSNEIQWGRFERRIKRQVMPTSHSSSHQSDYFDFRDTWSMKDRLEAKYRGRVQKK